MGKGDYYNYLVTLTKQHYDVLPLSYLAGRRGHTMLSIVVLEDGTIGRISIKQRKAQQGQHVLPSQIPSATTKFAASLVV